MIKLFQKISAIQNNRRLELERTGIFGFIFSKNGYVLIIVLIVSSLLITVSGHFFISARTNIGYMSRFRDEAQAVEIATIGITLGTFLLDVDKTGKTGSVIPGRNTNAAIDCYDDIWAIDFPSIPFEDGTLKIEVRDEQSKINASIVANEFVEKTTYYKILLQFFRNMGFTSEIPDSIHDWIDINDNPLSDGAETFDYYSTLPRPYRAKNMSLDSIEELLMIRYMTPEIYYGMGGGNAGKEADIVDNNMYLTLPDLNSSGKSDDKKDEIPVNERRIGPEKSRALPEYIRAYGENSYTSDLNKININTAPFRVISALTDTMTPDKVATLIRRRMTKPFTAVSEVQDLIVDKEENKPILNETLCVSSQIYTIRATGTFRGTSVTINTAYNRTTKRFYYYGIR